MSLPDCRYWADLEKHLKKRGANMRYKYCGNINQKQGVLFSKNGFEFSGSKIDRQFSYSKLKRHFTQAQQKPRIGLHLQRSSMQLWKLSVGIYRPIWQYNK